MPPTMPAVSGKWQPIIPSLLPRLRDLSHRNRSCFCRRRVKLSSVFVAVANGVGRIEISFFKSPKAFGAAKSIKLKPCLHISQISANVENRVKISPSHFHFFPTIFAQEKRREMAPHLPRRNRQLISSALSKWLEQDQNRKTQLLTVLFSVADPKIGYSWTRIVLLLIFVLERKDVWRGGRSPLFRPISLTLISFCFQVSFRGRPAELMIRPSGFVNFRV